MNILQIGDSHSVLAYGVELNRLLRSVPGATVTAFASSGSSPASWLSGYVARTTAVPPFLMIRPDGSEDLVPPGKERPTPNLGALIGTLAPDLVLVSLGANQRWQSPAQIAHDVANFAQVATKNSGSATHRAKLVWVGPPPARTDIMPRVTYEAFQAQLAAAVGPYGRFIASGPLVPAYVGLDGLHYTGRDGEAVARSWARSVFNQLGLETKAQALSDGEGWSVDGLRVLGGIAGSLFGFGLGGPWGAGLGAAIGYGVGRTLT